MTKYNMLFIMTKYSMHILGVSPSFKLQKQRLNNS